MHCPELPGGDGGGFHVAKGKRGAIWNPATSPPGTCGAERSRVAGIRLGLHALSKPNGHTGTSAGKMPLSEGDGGDIGPGVQIC